MKVAVVGGGVSGLAATWLLNEHSDHDVELIESSDYAGGHAHTVPFVHPSRPGNEPCWVEAGFILFNKYAYPTFSAFLDLVGIRSVPAEMSFSACGQYGDCQWAGGALSQVWDQWEQNLSPAHWRTVWEVIRFNALATEVLDDGFSDEVTVGAYLKQHGYSDRFRETYLFPIMGAIWFDRNGCDFPIRALVLFMHNHHLLQIVDAPQWLSISGGSRSYVDRIVSRLPPGRLRLNTPVASATSHELGDGKYSIELKSSDGRLVGTYDHVIFATHANHTLEILDSGDGGATKTERRVLGAYQFIENRATLHVDPKMMPGRRELWSAWNHQSPAPDSKPGAAVALTYWMNHLQTELKASKFGDIFVTLNPSTPPSPDLTLASWVYQHPVNLAKTVRKRGALETIQNKRGISFAGAWTGLAFHEDGFTSGLRVAVDHLGARCPVAIQAGQRGFARFRTPSARLTRAVVRALDMLGRSAAMWLMLLAWVLSGMSRWMS